MGASSLLQKGSKMHFEDLLKNKPLQEHTQDEIKEIISQLELPEVERFEKEIRKTRKKTTTKKSKNAQQRKDNDFEKLLQKGLK